MRVTPLRIAAMVSVSVLVSVDDDSDAVGELVMLVHALSIEDIEDTSVEVPVEQLVDRIQWSDQLK